MRKSPCNLCSNSTSPKQQDCFPWNIAEDGDLAESGVSDHSMDKKKGIVRPDKRHDHFPCQHRLWQIVFLGEGTVSVYCGRLCVNLRSLHNLTNCRHTTTSVQFLRKVHWICLACSLCLPVNDRHFGKNLKGLDNYIGKKVTLLVAWCQRPLISFCISGI